MSSQDGIWGPHSLSYVAHTMAMRPAVDPAATASMLACSSFLPESSNFVDLLSINHDAPQMVRSVGRLPHYYPPSRMRWKSPDLLLTSGDYIRIWNTNGELRRLLRHDENSRGVCSPITSNDVDAGTGLVSCDVYGICALWDVEAGRRTGAIDLNQPLCDVAFGPNGLLAVAGERGDVFVMDPRQPENVDILPLREQVCGPARMAWAPSSGTNAGTLAVAWQGERGGLAIYKWPLERDRSGQLLQSASPQCGAVADLKWSEAPGSADYLCCASEGGGVEVWNIGSDAARGGPCFNWQPRSGEVCTSLALSVRRQQQFVTLATMPAQPAPGGSVASLWVAALPEFSQAADTATPAPPAASTLPAPAAATFFHSATGQLGSLSSPGQPTATLPLVGRQATSTLPSDATLPASNFAVGPGHSREQGGIFG